MATTAERAILAEGFDILNISAQQRPDEMKEKGIRAWNLSPKRI